MSDFSVTVGGDFSELLSGFKQVERTAQQSGQAAGQALGGGIQGAVNRSIDALLADLGRLKAQKASVSVDGSQVAGLTQQITAVQKQIDTLRSARVALQVDSRSIDGLNQKLTDLQAELGRVAIGSQRFRELQTAIQSTERELAKAGQSADGFNLIDGAIQGLAFSLTNTVTNAAGSALRAIGGLITGFAELDTEIRQAAAASGEAGAYDKIARTIDQVGIEAAGTQMEVAKLATELIRGGMTVEQMNASLGAIVRGAEATGTGFAQMGSVVSSSLKGFGLQAEDANRVVDALVTGANASATSVEGMGMAFKYAAPVARIMGVSVEELGVAVGLLTNAGIDASEAGVTLRNGLSKLASAAPQTGGSMQKLTGQAKMAADSMKTLGINIYNADGTLQPMGTTLLKLKGAFDQLGPSSKIRLAANLFGGEDDGTKWLALLNQSEEDIKKMTATMANTKGATDTARNAMQGFQMAMNQLGGTLDSLGKTLGGVAAAAFAPLVALANQVVGVIAGLPAPVKTAVAAFILLAGASAAATAAMVIFQRAMQVTVVQTAAAEISSLASTMITTLGGAIKGVAAIIPGLLTQLSLIGSVNAGTAISALATTLKTVLVGGFTAASQAVVAFGTYLTSVQFGSFVAGVQSAIVALAPLVLALAAVTAAVVAWQYVLGGSKEGADSFADAQGVADKAVAKLGEQIEKTGAKAVAGRPFLIGYFQDAREQMAQLAAAKGLTALQDSFTQVQMPALAFLNTLKAGATVTAAQATEALKYVESLKQIASAAQTTAQSLRVKAEAAQRAGDPQLAAQYLQAARTLDSEAAASSGLSAALTVQINRSRETGAATAQQAVLTEEQKKAVQERTKAEDELNKILASAPVRNLEAQLTVGQQLLGLTKAVGDLEQSRFSVAKAGLQFELKALQDRGAGESIIAAKKAEIDQADRAALSARYQALTQQQALEQAMLQLSQEKARIEANLQVLEQKANILKAQADFAKAATDEERAAAQAQINLQNQILGVVEEKAGTLAKTQPLERAIAAATAETARNGLQAQAAAEGYRIAADGSLVRTQGLANSMKNVAVYAGNSATEQERYRRIAEQSGLAIGKAADGSVVLGRTQQEVNKAVTEMNRQLGGTKGGYDNAGKAAGGTKTATQQIEQALKNAGAEAGDLSDGIGDGAKAAGAAKGAADGLGKSLDAGKTPAGAIASAFTSTGKSAPAAAQGARDFAAYLSSAKTFAERIASLNLGDRMASVRDATRDAATQARTFYEWLLKASGLPGSRWSGGPVDAGEAYKVNELGQEALLAGGRLSLIQAPANSIWRAPSSGVVIPAGITARLQDAGALPSPGGIAAVGGNAELAIEIGKLRQEVGELARKQWNISVTQRTGPTGSQVLRTLQQLR
jgi:TP901 family phage tail tape measure protein